MSKETFAGLLSLGQGHFVPLDQVTLIAPAAALGPLVPGEVLDVTLRSRSQTVILVKSGRPILSSLSPDEVAARYARARLALAEAAAKVETA